MVLAFVLSYRNRNEDELEKLATDWTKHLMPDDVESRLQEVGVPSHIVARPRDVYEDIQLKERNYFIPIDHLVMGKQSYELQSYFILSKTPCQINRPSPCLG